MSANEGLASLGEPREETSANGGGSSALLSGGDERSEPESPTSSLTLASTAYEQACAFYMGAYVGKQFRARAPEDKGMRTVRYSLKHRHATVNWMWANGRGLVWRRGCRGLAMALRLDDLGELGEKWQWRYRKQITWLGEHDAIPYFIREENGDFSTFDEDWNSLWKWWRRDSRR